VKLNVRDRRGLARQPRFIKIRNIVAIVVEQVENGQRNVEIVPEMKASLEVHQRRGPGGDAAVLDQRRFAKVADPGAAEPTARPLKCQAERCHLLDGSGDVIARRIVPLEPRMRPGQIQVHDQPVERRPERAQLDTATVVKNSVSFQGPSEIPSFGETMESSTLPLFADRSLSTSNSK